MTIQVFPSGPLATNAYVVSCSETKRAAIFDPAPNSFDSIVKYISGHDLIPDKILLTHSHWDHIADVAPLKLKYGIPVYIHPEDALNLEKPGSDGLPCWISVEGIVPDYQLKEDDIISIGNLLFIVLHTPGHSPGCVCFYEEAHHILISGDTLFKGSIGNISFPTSRPKLIWNSLKKLAELPKETVVYPGHGPTTTIGNEPWLSKAEEVFGD
jgi:hydroxyacylglutathione hydrolase